jgi:hypothetical protein
LKMKKLWFSSSQEFQTSLWFLLTYWVLLKKTVFYIYKIPKSPTIHHNDNRYRPQCLDLALGWEGGTLTTKPLSSDNLLL